MLEPLRVAHAREMAPVLDDERLHAFTGGSPLGEQRLRECYGRLVAGRSPDGSSGWLNWVIRERESGGLLGAVQATLTGEQAELAWVVGTAHQGRGVAGEAALGMAGWLRGIGVVLLVAHLRPDNAASAGVARALGLEPTDEWKAGERRWEGR